MCGIAGLFGRNDPDFTTIADAGLRHRGPDGASAFVEEGATLVARRLALLDPSPAGAQPMVSADGRYVIVFNGEIYNFRELRRGLLERSVALRSNGDTEVVLELFAGEGPRCLGRLRGMFAFAVYDRIERTAFVARDPLGIKPLHVWRGADGAFAFASEVRTLLAAGLARHQLDATGLAHYLAFGSLPSDRTLVAGVQPLPPGHFGVWRAGTWLEERFWAPDFTPRIADAADAVRTTRAALEASIAAHCVSDEPVGLFLSGGLDSAAILALAGGGVTAITVGLADAALDESITAGRVARHFGAEHHVVTVTPDRAEPWSREFTATMDQPSVDGFNTYCAARAASELGFKAMLSGAGGDELFAGYPSFTEIPRLLAARRLVQPAAGRFGAALAAREDAGGRRMAALLGGAATVDAVYAAYRSLFTPREVGALLATWGIAAPEPIAADDWGIAPAAFPTDLDRLAWLETTNFLGNRLLADTDDFAMAVAVEVRVPFADAALLDALSPIAAPIRLAPDKALLKAAVPELPAWLTAMPKRGFTLPFARWFDGGFLAGTRLPALPAGLDAGDWSRRWALIVLGAWLERHLGLSLYERSSAA